MVAVTYGIRPYGGSPTGWGSPRVLILLACAVASLVAFVMIERRVAEPMFRLRTLPHPRLHLRHPLDLPGGGRPRRPDVHADHLAAGNLAAPARLRLHRDAALGRHLHAAPDRGDADRRTRLPGISPTASALGRSPPAGCSATALSFGLLLMLPIDFPYPAFAAILLLNGISMGMFASPNRAAVMNSLPRRRARRRRRHEPDLPELGPGDVGRDLLHAPGGRVSPRACPRR